MTIRILQGDVRDMLATLPDESVHCVVTSPPYWGLRDYGISGQIGLEPTMGEHIDTMVDVFREVRRVLRKDGTCWLNYGDCYATAPNGRSAADTKAAGKDDRTFRDKPFSTVGGSLKPKDLCMIPNRLAIALQDDGWWVRSEIIWAKPNPMPESVTDRPATAHEKVWLLSKSARYFYDAEAGRRPMAAASVDRLSQDVDSQEGSHRAHAGDKTNGTMKAVGAKGNAKTFRGGNYANGSLGERDSHGNEPNESGKANLRNVWTIPTKGFSEAHFATYPPALVETCIKAGTSEKGCCAECGAPWVREMAGEKYCPPIVEIGERNVDKSRGDKTRKLDGKSKAWRDTAASRKSIGWSPSCQCNAATIPCTVLDPFIGSGTTAMVADRLQRDCIGIDLNTEYVDLAVKRITDDAGMFAEIVT